ncbi:MAG: mobile mystery protein A [Gammaproteobacteria bacterium]|nr:mobile mystery protein A [Gammaproteobacteria bacterium]
MKTQILALKQLDRRLESLQAAKPCFKSLRGVWIRTIRKTLGMTLSQLASRLNVNRSRVIRIEQDEVREALTLKTLHQVSEALGCELVYALVPKSTLYKAVKQQANKIAAQSLRRVSHSMALEQQQVTEPVQEEEFQELVNELLSRSLKHLWEEKEKKQ